MINGQGRSDRPEVPGKSPNNAGPTAAEGTEGSGLAKGNLPQQNASRTPSRNDAPSALERVRLAAAETEAEAGTPPAGSLPAEPPDFTAFVSGVYATGPSFGRGYCAVQSRGFGPYGECSNAAMGASARPNST